MKTKKNVFSVHFSVNGKTLIANDQFFGEGYRIILDFNQLITPMAGVIDSYPSRKRSFLFHRRPVRGLD
ncbi:hypothetical protein DXJ95_22805 [Vibrio parahaemolyticus]|nr:hypothetical protein DXJ95_22805 [Vibrio parahaemolyticus]